MRFLILHFDAPMQSWGSSLGTTVREQGSAPTLSGVVGVIANALGRGRGDDMSDLVYPMAVRTDRTGVVERDYQTIGTQTGIGKIPEGSRIPMKVNATTKNGAPVGRPTVRYYQADAAHVVALAESPGSLDLETVAEALRRPARPLYLGRRAFPVAEPIVRGGIVEADDIVSALALVPAPERRDDHRLLTVEAGPSEPGVRRLADVPLSYGHYGTRHVCERPWKEMAA